ncbi:MAG: hypothetical protein AAAC47_24230 [Pararhizobium sp.]
MKKDLFVSHGSTLRELTFVAQVEMDALTHIKLNGVTATGIADDWRATFDAGSTAIESV